MHISNKVNYAVLCNCSGSIPSPCSLHDAESRVDRLGSLNHFDNFKRNVFALQALEQSRAAAEQHGDEVNRDFVNQAAFETAKNLAGDKDISTTGADVAQQLLKLGLIDEISIHLVPVLFGSGTRLFEGLDSEHISLETLEVIETKEAIHMRFRVVK